MNVWALKPVVDADAEAAGGDIELRQLEVRDWRLPPEGPTGQPTGHAAVMAAPNVYVSHEYNLPRASPGV